MKLYCGIDLHSSNNMVALINSRDQVLFEQRLPNVLGVVLHHLEPYRSSIQGIVVESTFNWYWLVDGLMEAGYRLHLANPSAMQQYSGLKHSDDRSDARWLARMLRLRLLPEGYIYPKEERPLRDLLRKRSQMVRQRTLHLLSIQNQLQRNTAGRLPGNDIKALKVRDLERWDLEPNVTLAIASNLRMLQGLDKEVRGLEAAVLKQAQLRRPFTVLQTASGIGRILALTIMLETGDIGRFASVGHFSSYCRCVPSQRLSNGKRKGKGNVRNGNRYLAWAFVEAAHYAIRFSPEVRRFYQRKQTRTNGVVALKAVAHKLARASYYMLRDQVPFDPYRSFR